MASCQRQETLERHQCVRFMEPYRSGLQHRPLSRNRHHPQPFFRHPHQCFIRHRPAGQWITQIGGIPRSLSNGKFAIDELLHQIELAKKIKKQKKQNNSK